MHSISTQSETSDPGTLDTNSSSLRSSAHKNAPTLSHRWLTTLLVVMCALPIGVIFALFYGLPQVYEGTLEAGIDADGLPAASFYDEEYYDREKVPTGELIVTNQSKQDWTHLNIQINKHYQIYDRQPIPAGETRRFKLDRFDSRTGAKFDLTYNPLRYVRVYARRPTKDRATYSSEFAWQDVK